MRVRRFSEGIERLPGSAASGRLGTFADGAARTPGASATARVGSFADGYRRAASPSSAKHHAARPQRRPNHRASRRVTEGANR